MINTILVRVFPEQIYNEADHEGLQNLLLFADFLFPHFVDALFKQARIKNPYKTEDFEVMHSVGEDYLSIRIEIKNHKYTDIRRVYIVFQAPLEKNEPIRNVSYYVVEDDNDMINCFHINENCKMKICFEDLQTLEEEENVIEEDYLERLKQAKLQLKV